MKKKFVTLLFAGAMTLCCSSLAMAAETETEFNVDELLSQMENIEVTEETVSGTAITWDDVQPFLEEEESLANGSFVADDTLGIKFYMPDFMEEQELTEEDKEGGMLRYFWNGSDAVIFISEEKNELGVGNAVEYEKVLEEAGEFDPMLADVNGIEGVLYFITPDEEDGQEIVAFAYIPEEKDKIVEFYMSPGDMDGEYVNLFRVVMGSIQMNEK